MAEGDIVVNEKTIILGVFPMVRYFLVGPYYQYTPRGMEGGFKSEVQPRYDMSVTVHWKSLRDKAPS